MENSGPTTAPKFNICHRDLKPDNVFLHRGRLVLADFGIAKAITEHSPLGPNAANITEIIGTQVGANLQK